MSERAEEKRNLFWLRVAVLGLLLIGGATGYFLYASEAPGARFPFRLGLDLAGGAHLVYRADVSEVDPSEVDDALEALRTVIERRVNSRDLSGVTGVFDASVQVARSSALSGVEEYRLVVELPGVTDVEEAKKLIGVTPLLEFKLLDPAYAEDLAGSDAALPPEAFISTGLTGRFLERATLQFGAGGTTLANEPSVVLAFDTEGAQRFAEITREHVGDVLAIFLDGEPIQMPVIREEIPSGTAVITGSFTAEEARDAVRNLNLGALPVPIVSQSTQTIGPSLGAKTLARGVASGLTGLSLVALFMVLWYRLPGLFAVLSLALYVAIVLAIFKLIPVTLTAAGIAGFILSIGMAVDANVLIFERMKEELAAGRAIREAVREGFARAWLSIRDGNVSSLLTAVIIFYAGTFLTRGFAITLSIGILVSMFTALTVTRTLLLAFGGRASSRVIRFLYGEKRHS